MDGSPLADNAFETFDCRATALNVGTPLDAGMSETGVLEPDEARLEGAGERTDELIVHVRGHSVAADRTVETAVVTGDPVETILAYTGLTGVDYVMMGGHDSPGPDLLRYLFGTVATVVTGEVSVPVTVVR